ncbi:MAG: nuclear transport factor 2 family protein [Chlorobiaceae bacterium]|nr:nuclear transport factor 2 family protein [Chlorobiaceae bacterium]NTV61009.1 nuclear transport factor 2 family protein [Chlorobiaceae bacterium]
MDTRELIETHHKAWTNGDFATARSVLADDLDFQGSINRFSTADDFIGTLIRFRRMVTDVTLQESLFEKECAALLYECSTDTPAGIIRFAEFFTVREGKISGITLVYDATILRGIAGTDE